MTTDAATIGAGPIPVCAVIATRDRAAFLARALKSIFSDARAPQECVIVDASDDSSTAMTLAELIRAHDWGARLRVVAATVKGAAAQRNQGTLLTVQPYVLYCDDDIVCEPGCVAALWSALESDARLGGVNAMITNQNYGTPGKFTRALFAFMNGRAEANYAGKILGPAVGVLPEDDATLGVIVPVEWLNTTCTLYRRHALPVPPFDAIFVGYSLMEDLALSLRVARTWKLANVRSARIFHDSQPGAHKSNPYMVARMELVNRHYIMTRILGRMHTADYLRLAAWEIFTIATVARKERLGMALWKSIAGKLAAIRGIRGADG